MCEVQGTLPLGGSYAPRHSHTVGPKGGVCPYSRVTPVPLCRFVSGSVEAACGLGLADGIVDLVLSSLSLSLSLSLSRSFNLSFSLSLSLSLSLCVYIYIYIYILYIH